MSGALQRWIVRETTGYGLLGARWKALGTVHAPSSATALILGRVLWGDAPRPRMVEPYPFPTGAEAVADEREDRVMRARWEGR